MQRALDALRARHLQRRDELHANPGQRHRGHAARPRAGLTRQDVRNRRGETEAIYLDSLDRQLALDRSPADTIRERWETEWEGQIEELVEFSAYRIQ